MISQLAAVLAPVVLCAGIGIVWGRLRQPFDTRMIAGLVLNVTTPCLILYTLTRLLVDPVILGEFALATVLMIAGAMAVGWLVLRVSGLSAKVYLPAMFLSNTGNTGLPLCLFAFGETGLAYGIVFFIVTIAFQYTAAPAIASGSRDMGKLLRMPVLWSIAISVMMMVLHVQPPDWISNTLKLLGNVTIPMMLFSLGVALSRLRPGWIGLGVMLSVAKLATGLAIGLGLSHLFGFSGPARGVMIIQSCMPAAVLAYIIAEHFGTEAEKVASLVVISTLLVFLALPGILWLVL